MRPIKLSDRVRSWCAAVPVINSSVIPYTVEYGIFKDGEQWRAGFVLKCYGSVDKFITIDDIELIKAQHGVDIPAMPRPKNEIVLVKKSDETFICFADEVDNFDEYVTPMW